MEKKLISAKEAIEIANNAFTVDKALEIVDEMIRTAAKNGDYSITLHRDSPRPAERNIVELSAVRDPVKKSLEGKGFKVEYLIMFKGTDNTLTISWS